MKNNLWMQTHDVLNIVRIGHIAQDEMDLDRRPAPFLFLFNFPLNERQGFLSESEKNEFFNRKVQQLINERPDDVPTRSRNQNRFPSENFRSVIRKFQMPMHNVRSRICPAHMLR